ncbi:hypothetical protein J7J81_01510 [bacterium]|nr:hypothetical protein [bacterium]
MAQSTGNLVSPEGIIMISIAAFLDVLSALLSFTIIGSKIVYGLGIGTIGLWQLFRSGNAGSLKAKKGEAKQIAEKFFKKHWKKLAVKAIPFLGDFAPIWTWTVYSELK